MKDFAITVMIQIPKKLGTNKCYKLRTTNLILHATKTLQRVMTWTISKIIEENIKEEQFGFRRGRETRKDTGRLWMIERHTER